MKSSTKLRILILISLGTLFAFSQGIKVNLNSNIMNTDMFLENRDDIVFNSENINPSEVSGKIYVDGNSGWIELKNAGGCIGQGTYSDPYVIADLVIDGGNSGSCIYIKNSDVYFKIENTTVSNSRGTFHAGIRLFNVNNFLLTNNTCDDSSTGIRLDYSNNATISKNTFIYNHFGLDLFNCKNNTISGNIAKYGRDGIRVISSFNIKVSGNKMNGCGLVTSGFLVSLLSITIDSTNLVNGKPILYHVNENNLKLDNITNAGQIMLVNCNNSILSNLRVSGGSSGISLSYCSNNSISESVVNANVFGIRLNYCNVNNISANSGSSNLYGIRLSGCMNSTISKNTLLTSHWGISLFDSEHSHVSNNSIDNGSIGIGIYASVNNLVSVNNIKNNYDQGIDFEFSDYNTVSGNTIYNNGYGIYLYLSKYNNISRNYLIENDQCIVEVDCEGNLIEFNNCPIRDNAIPGYCLIVLLGIISIISIIIYVRTRNLSFLKI